MKRTVFDWLLLTLCIITAVSCSKDGKYDDDDHGKVINPSAVVVTLSATKVSFYSATLNGRLNVADELMPVVEFGFEYSESADMSFSTKLAIKVMGTDKTFQCVVTDLKDETKYYYRTYIRYTSTGIFVYGEMESFTTNKFGNPSGKENGHDYVDLGLPSGVKWATCNIGASCPEEYGSYFAWGETVGDPYIKDKTDGYSKSFYWDAYKFNNGRISMTKYCIDSDYGTIDNKTTLEPNDDAAHVNWGGNWRMPTGAEIDELIDNCTWKWIIQNGVNGYKVIGTKTGYTDKCIFLPAAGGRKDDYLDRAGSFGYYWSSSLSEGFDAQNLIFTSNYNVWGARDRYNGNSVRPVCQILL